jgi:hypothetical protein
MAINATRVDKTTINPIATYSSMLAPHKVPMFLPIPGALPEIEKMPTKGRYLCSFARSAKYNITDLQGLVKVSLFTKLMILLLYDSPYAKYLEEARTFCFAGCLKL